LNQAFGLYSHIQTNRRRTVAVFVGLLALVGCVSYAVCLIYVALTRFDLTSGVPTATGVSNLLRAALPSLRSAAPYIMIGVVIWTVIGYFGHQFLIDTVTGGRRITRREDPELWDLLENLCISRGMPMPKLKVMDEGAMNAFASGMTRDQFSVTVTTGLRNGLTKDELEAVLAHELTHIRNGDVSLMVMAVVIAGIAGFFVELFLRLFGSGNGSSGGSSYSGRSGSSGSSSSSSEGSGDGKGMGAIIIAIMIAVAIMILAWLLSGMLRFFLSRTREFLADAGAVELTKNPEALVSALMKISGKAEINHVPSAIMELCFENYKQGIFDLFATHPPIDERIEALVNHAGAQPGI
jgi:heat shock protein HtpX